MAKQQAQKVLAFFWLYRKEEFKHRVMLKHFCQCSIVRTLEIPLLSYLHVLNLSFSTSNDLLKFHLTHPFFFVKCFLHLRIFQTVLRWSFVRAFMKSLSIAWSSLNVVYECWGCWPKGNIKQNWNTYFNSKLNETELCISILLRLKTVGLWHVVMPICL